MHFNYMLSVEAVAVDSKLWRIYNALSKLR